MITWEGAEYPFDISYDKVTHEEWCQIKDKLKLTIGQFYEGVEQLDPDAITGLYWLTLRSDGQHDGLVLKRFMGFKTMDFMLAYAEEAQRVAKETAAAGEGEADPTTGGSLPAGETPATTTTDAPATSATSGTGSSRATSGSSATSTSSSSPATATSGRVTSPS